MQLVLREACQDTSGHMQALSKKVATIDDLKDDDFKAYLASQSDSSGSEAQSDDDGTAQDADAVRARCEPGAHSRRQHVVPLSGA